MAYILRRTTVKYSSNLLNINRPTGHAALSHLSSVRPMSSIASEEVKENVRPVSEMPGMTTMTMMKAFMTKKLEYKGKSTKFEVTQIHKLWSNFKDLYGPIFKMQMAGEPTMVALTNPDDIEKMFRITMDDPVRNGFYSLKKIRDKAMDNYFEKKGGILVENNEEWRRVRSKVQTPMMKPKNIVRYLTQMDQVSIEFTDRIAELQKKHGEMPSNFQQELYKWALESVGTVAINRRLGCLDPNLSSDSTQMKLIDTVNQMFVCFTKLEMEFPWWRYIPSPTLNKLNKQHDVLFSTVLTHITEAEEVLKRKFSEGKVDDDMTLLELLLQTDGLTRKDVVTFMIDMFFAGIDTTSHTLGFTLYLLARNKNAQQKLQEEIDTVLGDGKEPITEEQLAQLSFLKACIKESLRIFPLVLGNARTLKEDAVFGGYLIPKDFMLVGANVISSKDEEYFPRPNEFLPERWMRDRPLGPIHPYASLPFSHGTRMCIGRRIAEQEMYTFLARVMHRFNIDYKYKDVDMITRLVAVPSEPLRFQFTERR